ncbi:hypothetical protein ACAG26_05190 [Mycobacterium sp. pUA109]|uniref:hypothetical protein n=1 Tax=Mycobacterium sp. pUA109 TaxID=3238982 RepID=UPI00351ABD8D
MSDIAARVQDYLDRTRDAFPPGSDRYYARIALDVALQAYRGGNFGIGAVAVVRSGSTADLFYGENAMAQPNAVIEHAETQAVLRVAAGAAPDHTITLPEPADAGLSVYGTVEPCPMCACVLTNAGVQRSVSTCLDGDLVRDGDYLASDGGANVLGDKYPTQPRVWRDIQRARGLRFELLAPAEPELRELSWKILAETREEIDELLATRPGVGRGQRR